MIASEETAAQTELLENVIATAQRLVKAERDKSKITPSYIADKVQMAAKMFAGDALVDIDFEKAISILIQRFSHWMGKATSLRDNTGHVDWLTAARKKEWHYWRRYSDFQESKLSDTVVDGLDAVGRQVFFFAVVDRDMALVLQYGEHEIMGQGGQLVGGAGA